MSNDPYADDSGVPAKHDPIKPRRQLEDTEMDITPMIDITFLLLIFFLVASKMDQATSVELPGSKIGDAVQVDKSVILTVAPSGGEGPARVFKGGGVVAENEIDTSDLAALEDEVRAYVEEQTALDSSKTWVIVKGGKGVKHRDVNRVEKAAADVAAIQNMAVAVMQEN